MRIYTRGGDRGKTLVLGGGRRYKDDARVEAYGAVDEAGALLGQAIAWLDPERDQDLREVLSQTAMRLWDVGADLARVPGGEAVFRTPDDAAAELEPVIDRYEAGLLPLTHFILRGGSPRAAALHVACTAVRRAERRAVTLSRGEAVHPPALAYLNRLSDLLFVLARVANARDGGEDVPYRGVGPVFH